MQSMPDQRTDEYDMSNLKDTAFRKTCELLQPFNADNVALSLDTNITADLNIDSVAVLDLIMEVEDIYDVSFPVNQLSEIRTIGNLVDAIQLQREGQQQREGSH